MATTIHKQPLQVSNQVLSHDQSIDCLEVGLKILTKFRDEWFWFLVCLMLFVVLGPFSCPIVLLTIFKLGLEDNQLPEPDSIP